MFVKIETYFTIEFVCNSGECQGLQILSMHFLWNLTQRGLMHSRISGEVNFSMHFPHFLLFSLF